MRLNVLFGAAVVAALTTLSPLPVSASEEMWMHNNSLMRFVFDEEEDLDIYYTVPRSGLEAIGVQEGTRLFSGSISAGGYVGGTAYVFKAGCKPAAYNVSGKMVGNIMELYGSAPIWAKNSCHVIGYGNNHNSVLVFKSIDYD